MSQYFPKPDDHSGGNVKVKYNVTKADLKEGTVIDTSNLAIKSDLAGLKVEVVK